MQEFQATEQRIEESRCSRGGRPMGQHWEDLQKADRTARACSARPGEPTPDGPVAEAHDHPVLSSTLVTDQ